MSDLRTAAQQALEALTPFVRGSWTPGLAVQAAAAMDRLKAALAEPVQDWALLEATQASLREHMAEIHRLRAALAEPVQEQVWVCPDSAEHRYQKPGHCEDCGKTLVQERNFCPRCGKRTNDIHTCTPPQEDHFCDTHCTWSDHAPGCVRAEPVQEPVAWRYKKEGGGWFVSDNEPQYVEQWNDIEEIQPLYTAPPQRKPLTEEEIDNIWDSEKAFADIYAIARAIERAHNITGDNT